MPIKILGPNRLAGPVNVPLVRELVVQVRDANNKPVKDNTVGFTAQPPDAVEFPGGQMYALVQTDAQGKASVRLTPRTVGVSPHKVIAEAADNHGKVEFEIDASDPDGTEVRQMDGTLVINNGGGRRHQPSRISWSAIAAMLAILVAGILLWKVIDKPSASSGGPIVIQQPGGGGSNVDPVARSDAQAALARVDAAKQELGEAFTQGDAETLTHAEGYTREYVRPTTRLALLTAREVRKRLTSGSGHSGGRTRLRICDRAPNTPGCH